MSKTHMVFSKQSLTTTQNTAWMHGEDVRVYENKKV